jgi:hypothetical protein
MQFSEFDACALRLWAKVTLTGYQLGPHICVNFDVLRPLGQLLIFCSNETLDPAIPPPPHGCARAHAALLQRRQEGIDRLAVSMARTMAQYHLPSMPAGSKWDARHEVCTRCNIRGVKIIMQVITSDTPVRHARCSDAFLLRQGVQQTVPRSEFIAPKVEFRVWRASPTTTAAEVPVEPSCNHGPA